MMQRYGKPSAPWFKAKRWFFDQDKELLAECLRIAELYLSQPKRENCMVCATPISTPPSFVKHNVPYHICPHCGHLNGAYQDTHAFCAGLYKEEESDIFSRMYESENLKAFEERRDSIYRPKVDFLIDALKEEKQDYLNMSFADFGAGSGYFVSALMSAGIKNVRGYEVSDTQVKLGNSMLGNEILIHHDMDDIVNLISSVEADVLSLVFVLEHVQNPGEVITAIKNNPNLQYAFIAVPMFSTSVFIEMAFPHFAHRHLACGHTHLYTPESLKWLSNKFSYKHCAEWWFGADMIDFYRMISMTLSASPDTINMVTEWENTLLPALDSMQLVLDKRHQSSELHFVARFYQENILDMIIIPKI